MKIFCTFIFTCEFAVGVANYFAVTHFNLSRLQQTYQLQRSKVHRQAYRGTIWGTTTVSASKNVASKCATPARLEVGSFGQSFPIRWTVTCQLAVVVAKRAAFGKFNG